MGTTVHAWQECYVCGKDVPQSWGFTLGGVSRDLISGDEVAITLFICKSCEKGSEE